MKPSFALNFTDSSIGLLHRTSRGWLEVGAVAFDEPDLANALTYLRGSALGLEPRGITTKLVIPNSQIRYMTLPAPGPDAASRRAQIRAALEGKTPYAVDDLVFDWSGTGKTVQVAVVARETLEEAESFARENRFNPASFAAIPEPGHFGGEPWFGPTTLAPSLLAEGEKVERDQDPIKIVGRAPKGEQEKPAPESEGKAGVPPFQPEPDARPTAPPDVAEVAKPFEVEAEPPAKEEPVASPAQQSETVSTVPYIDQPEAVPLATPPAAATTEPAPPAVEAVSARVTESVISDQVDPMDEDLADLPPIPPARIAAAVRAAESARVNARTNEPAKKPSSSSSRTNGAKSAQKPVDQRPAPVMPPRLTAVPGGGGASGVGARIPPVEAEWPLERVASAGRTGKSEPTRSGPMITSPSIPMPRDRKLTVVQTGEAAAITAPTGGKGRSEAETMTVFGARKTGKPGKPRYLFVILLVLLLAILASVFIWSSIVQVSRNAEQPALAALITEAAVPDASSPTTAIDVPEAASVTGPSTVPALIAPAEADPAAKAAETSTDTAPEVSAEGTAAPAELTAAAEDTTTATDSGLKTDLAATSTDPEAEADLAAALPETAAVPRPEPAPLDGDALATATGKAGTSRIPGNEPRDEIFLALVENRVATSDSIALVPPVLATDAVPGPQLLPPPFGTLYQFDAQGRIIPTAEGIVTPEGVRLVAGKPPVVPPVRPEPPAPVVRAAVEPAQADPAKSAAEPFFADPALAGARPRLRPDNSTPLPEATNDGANLIAADTTRLTSLKPRARPPALLARGEAILADNTAQASAAAQAASASLVAGLDDSTPSPLAVAVSRKPAARPQTLDRSIEAAVQLAAADASLVPDTALLAPVVEAPVEPPPLAAEPAPLAKAPTLKLPKEEPTPSVFTKEEANDPAVVELDEPDNGGNSSGSTARGIVAKKATYANVLNMSKISLIGVFGSPSNRYAMVRQPGGRFVKVEVGDRIDGGRIAAISEREVNYVKNGQTHTLSMPRG